MEIQAPEGIEIGLTIYATSDSAGLDVALKLGGLPMLAPFEGERDSQKMLASLLPNIADDWRLMTKGEIAEYKAEQEEEERQAKMGEEVEWEV